jgi:hypothetical protein
MCACAAFACCDVRCVLSIKFDSFCSLLLQWLLWMVLIAILGLVLNRVGAKSVSGMLVFNDPACGSKRRGQSYFYRDGDDKKIGMNKGEEHTTSLLEAAY